MNFKITKNAVLKRKYTPIYTILYTIVLVFLILFPHFYQKQEVDWTQVIIFSLIMPIAAGASIFGAYRDIKEMKLLSLEVKDEGIYLYSPQGILILPFEIIKTIKLKYKNNEIKKFIVKTNEGKTADYSDFDNLNILNNELKKYLNKEIWK